MNPRPAVVALMGFLSLPLSGCSFLFVHGPPAGYQNMDDFTCTQSEAAPILDIIWGSSAIASALFIASIDDPYNDDELKGAAATYVVSGALVLFAATRGFKKTRACRDAKQQLAVRQQMGGGRTPATAPPSQVSQGVVITPSSGTLAVGERLQLVAIAHGSNGAELPMKLFAWSSSNDAIASVSNAGLVTAHAPGTVVIAANSNNVVGTANIVVAPPQE